jgi:multidrug efflux pump
VDDAIVVLENISRRIEEGMPPMEAALKGTREVGFTVISMSLSLIAVFIPILLMGGHHRPAVPRVRRHAIGCDPGIDGALADRHADDVRAPAEARETASQTGPAVAVQPECVRLGAARLRAFAGVGAAPWPVMMVLLAATICLNVYLYVVIPKGFFPQQDTGG